MQTVYFQKNPVEVYGTIPAPGTVAPDFELTSADLAPVKLSDLAGKRVVLNIFPSLDTGVCAASVRRFNKEAADYKDTVVLCVSMDLPFAAKRFCVAEGIEGVTAASAFRHPAFGQEYGVQIVDGPLANLLARAVVVIGKDGKVLYSQLVEEITNEPDYDGVKYVLEHDK
ncbi:MAG: thiol peroxidase [Muribaculaceae bacterium]|nr:thiol peroxidase [Muribaculaceae bacterium]